MDAALTTIVVALSTLLPIAAIFVFLSRRRGQTSVKKMRHPVAGEAHVVSSSLPDEGSTATRFSMSAVVRGEGVPPTSVRHKGIAPTAKWPHPGSVLPITLDRADPTVFRIEWDQMPAWSEVGTAEADRLAEAMRGGMSTPGQPQPISSAFDIGGTLIVNGQTMDAGQFPGLHEEITRLVSSGQQNPEGMKAAISEVLGASGVTVANTGAPTSATAPSASADPAERLQRISDLRRRGLIDETEYQNLRRGILGDL